METEKHPIFNRYAELKEFIRILKYEIQQAQRPANEIVMDDEDVMRLLKISKRKLQYMKAGREIAFHMSGSSNRTYFLLSDVLEWLNKKRIECISDSIRIK